MFILLIIVVILMIAYNNAYDANDKEEWNGGHCHCGGSWEYVEKYGKTKTYKCSRCGKRMYSENKH